MASLGATMSLAVAVACRPSVSATEIVNGYEPAVCGVPEMRPVDALIASPGGSVPATIDHVFGSGTVAVICSEYAALTVPTGAVSGPSVSFGTPGLMGIVNRFSPTLPWQPSSPTGSAILI